MTSKLDNGLYVQLDKGEYGKRVPKKKSTCNFTMTLKLDNGLEFSTTLTHVRFVLVSSGI